MGRGFTKFCSKYAERLSDKHNESKSLAVNRLKTEVYFGLLKSCLLCLRDSRSDNKNVIKIDDNMMVANKLALMN